jgi:hypothetical protein
MELVVDLSTAAVSLRDHDGMTRFAVLAIPEQPGDGDRNGALGALAAALSVHDAGTVDPDGDVLVPVIALERLAGEAASREGQGLGSDWGGRFAAMLQYAATKGWLADDGSIRAHVEWGS